MKVQDAIRHACQTVALAYQSIGDYTKASDGFCDDCPYAHSAGYSNDGEALRYVREAVVEKLRRDGFKIADGFDPETGDEYPNTVHESNKWECFCDESYYGLWSVREVGEKRWNGCFHVQTQEEGEGLRDLLNEFSSKAKKKD